MVIISGNYSYTLHLIRSRPAFILLKFNHLFK